MMSLFLTALLGLFCCSSVNYNALDHTKEIEKKEHVIKNAVYDDDTLVMTHGDLLSSDTCYYFLSTLIEDGYTIFQPSNQADYSVTFQSDGRLFDGWEYTPNNYVATPTIVFTKDYQDSIERDGNTFYRCLYTLRFNTSDNKHYDIYWYVSAFWDLVRPFVFSSYSSNVSSTIAQFSTSLTYIEEASYGSNLPMTKYYLPKYKDDTTPNSIAYSQGYDAGWSEGKRTGYQMGYNTGLSDGASYDDTALTIFTGIIEVGLLPVNVFLQILNFEVFGINIAGFVSAMLTVTIVIIIVRFLVGRKDD